MYIYATLRLLLAAFFLYFSWPIIPYAVTSIEKLFWGSWLILLYAVLGGNLATLLKLSEPPTYEQPYDENV